MIVPEDLQNLQAWYEHRFGKKGAARVWFPPPPRSTLVSHRARSRAHPLLSTDSADAPTLVVLLEDLEAMDGKVLTQLIDALA